MSNKKLEFSRRKVLAGLGTAGVAAAGAGLGTTAYLNDEESFTGNSITAGELDLFVHYEFTADQGSVSGNLQSPTSGTVQGDQDGDARVSYQLSDVKPGDSGSLACCFSLVNNPAYLWLSGAISGESENGTTEPEGDSPWEQGGGELATYTRASLYYTGDTSDANDADVLITEGTLYGVLSDLEAGRLPLHGNGDPTAGVVDRPTFDGGDSTEERTDETCLRLDWEVPTWVGNEIQGDAVTFDLTFEATQARNNDGTGDWRVVQPGDDLQSAVDDASAGDTLFLASGTHSDPVTVDKSVDVRGEGPTNTVYEGPGSGHGMDVEAADVRIGDFTGTNWGQAVSVNGQNTSGGRTSNVLLSNVVAEANTDRSLVVDYADDVVVRDARMIDGGNDGLTAWYTNDSHFETLTARGNADNGVYVNGDGNVLLDSTVEENAEEGVDVSWKDDLGPSTQRVRLDNVAARDNGQSGSLPPGEGEDVELHDDGADDSVAANSALLREVDTSGSGAPLGLRLVNVAVDDVLTDQCSFPNGIQDGNDNDVDP